MTAVPVDGAERPPGAPTSTLVYRRTRSQLRWRAVLAAAAISVTALAATLARSLDWLAVCLGICALSALWFDQRRRATRGAYAIDGDQLWVRFGRHWRGPVDFAKVHLADVAVGQYVSYFVVFESPRGTPERGFSAAPSTQAMALSDDASSLGFLIPLGMKWPDLWSEFVRRLNRAEVQHTRELELFLDRYSSDGSW